MGIQYVEEVHSDSNIVVTWEVANEGACRSVLMHFDTAPTSAADVQVWIISPLGDDYSTMKHEVAATNETDISIDFDPPILVPNGWKIEVRYANPDSRKIGITVIGVDNYQKD